MHVFQAHSFSHSANIYGVVYVLGSEDTSVNKQIQPFTLKQLSLKKADKN